ncbi:hypothetical protein HYW42_01360 [Candidatus Daviesbacteria bacterium]|nr:hypothetical protein [Candidatus Daviesbacteria bacterium]
MDERLRSAPPKGSIPESTSLDQLRQQERAGRVSGFTPRRPIRSGTSEPEFRFDPGQHRFPTDLAIRSTFQDRPAIEKLNFWADVVACGDRLSVVLGFNGVSLGQGPFWRGRVNDPLISAACFTPVELEGRRATLWLVVTGDIIEATVIPTRRRDGPPRGGELYVDVLTAEYDPAKMAVSKRDGRVYAGFERCS